MRHSILLATLLLLVVQAAAGQAATGQAATSGTAEDRVREIYDMISVEPGGALPDWPKIQTFFVDDAVIFMRVARDRSEVFTVEEWVADFKAFIETAKVVERGFTERIVRMRSTELRDVAQVTVLYEASFSTGTRPPQQGIDFIQLARVAGEWRIVSIVNDIPQTPEQIPAAVRE